MIRKLYQCRVTGYFPETGVGHRAFECDKYTKGRDILSFFCGEFDAPIEAPIAVLATWGGGVVPGVARYLGATLPRKTDWSFRVSSVRVASPPP